MTNGEKQIAVFGPGMPVDVTDDWPKMPEAEEVALWEAEWRAKLAAEARARAA